jgi:hypothetical protein
VWLGKTINIGILKKLRADNIVEEIVTYRNIGNTM